MQARYQHAALHSSSRYALTTVHGRQMLRQDAEQCYDLNDTICIVDNEQRLCIFAASECKVTFFYLLVEYFLTMRYQHLLGHDCGCLVELNEQILQYNGVTFGGPATGIRCGQSCSCFATAVACSCPQQITYIYMFAM